MGLLEDLFSFVSKKRFLTQKLQESQALKAFILEPILTPSGLVDDPTHDTGFIIIDPNPEIDHSLDFPPDAHPELDHAPDVDLHLSTAAIPPEHIDLLPFIHDSEPAIPSVEHLFDSGIFTVGASGKVSIDYLFDGGGYQGQLAIFNLKDMEEFDLNTETGLADFIHEAAHRALSNSDLGHVVIADATEGAKFSGMMPSEWENHNFGQYQGVKTFDMEVGDKFAVMLVPNGTVQQVLDCNQDADIRPLFSLNTVNPNEAFHAGQIADITGDGNTFVLEDLRTDHWTDRDYNDIIFQVRGATGTAAHLDDVINPELDWRHSDVGQELIAYAQAQIEPVNPHPTLPEVPVANHPLIGIIDTGFSANNPDINYSHIILGHDYIDGDSNPLLSSGVGNEHGTHVLGIIGATQNNGIGIDGINDDAPIWISRAVGSGHWSDSLVEFVDAAKASHQPNAVVNLSLDLTQINHDGSITTRYEFTPLERAAIEYARQNHVLIVAAAGNNGGVMSVLGQASQEFDNIITVGAADGLERAEYSSYGSGLDILAPGGTSENPILSAVGDGVGTMAGTSVAAAEVTGAISQIWAANPDLSYRQVIEILKSTATDLDAPGWDAETGSGLLNLVAAVSVARTVVPEDFIPLPWITPETWSGAGVVTPEERAVSGGNSIATAPAQPSANFSDNDRVDSTQPEKYYQFTVDRSGYVRWTLTRRDGNNQDFPEFPYVSIVKADGSSGAHKFLNYGGASVDVSAVGQGQLSVTNGTFLDPGTYYLKVKSNAGTTVQDYSLSTVFTADQISAFSGAAQFRIEPRSAQDNISTVFLGATATSLNTSGVVEFDPTDTSKRAVKYELEVKENGKLVLNFNSPEGVANLAVRKLIGDSNSNSSEAIFATEIANTGNEPIELNLNPGKYQISVTPPSDFDTFAESRRSFVLNSTFSLAAPQPGEGKVPANAGAFVKTITSNGVITYYYTNGYLMVQPNGYQTWYALGSGTPAIAPPKSAPKIYYFKEDWGKLYGRKESSVYLGEPNSVYDYKFTIDPLNINSPNSQYLRLALRAPDGSSILPPNATIELLDDKMQPVSVSSPANSPLIIANLPGGTYYARVKPKQNNVVYQVIAHLDSARESLATARDLGTYSGRHQFKDFVGGTKGDGADYYRFNVDAASLLRFSLKDLEGATDANVELLDDKGNVIAAGDGNNYGDRSLNPGAYYIRVTPNGSDNTNYTLTLNLAHELGTLIGNTAVKNRLAAPYTDDIYRFRVDEPGVLDMVLQNIGANADALLFNDINGNGVAEANELISNIGILGSLVKHKYQLESGNYLLQIKQTGTTNLPTQYDLSLNFDSAGNTKDTARDLNTPHDFDRKKIYTGRQEFTDSVGSKDTDDYYHFTLDELLNIDLEAHLLRFSLKDQNGNDIPATDAKVTIIDSKGNPVFLSQTNGVGVTSLPGGDYYLHVEKGSSNKDIKYKLALQVDSARESGNVSAALNAARYLGEFSGRHQFDDFVGVTRDSADYYRFDVKDKSYLQLNLADALGGDANWELLNDKGEVLSPNRNGKYGNIYLDSGSYYLRVIPDNGNNNANYTLTMNMAQELGTFIGGQEYKGSVGVYPDKFYRFNLDAPGDLRLSLDGLQADANVRLIKDDNGNGIVDAGEVVASPGYTDKTGTANEYKEYQDLPAGNYLVQISAVDSNQPTDYRLKMNIDRAGNTIAEARDLNSSEDFGRKTIYTGRHEFVDFVDETDPDDYYKFTLDTLPDISAHQVLLALRDANNNDIPIADAEIKLLNDKGQSLPFSVENGVIRTTLNGGTYYVDVKPGSSGADTNYKLVLNVDSAPQGFTDWSYAAGSLYTLSNVRILGPLAGRQQLKDFVGATKGDGSDYYGFEIAEHSLVRFSLADLDAGADAKVELVDDKGNVISLDPGSVNNKLGAYTLEPGKYFLRVLPVGNSNTNYTLTLNALKELGIYGGRYEYSGSVGKPDYPKFYRFSVDAPGKLKFALKDGQAGAKLQLLTDANWSGTEVVSDAQFVPNVQEVAPGVYETIVTPGLPYILMVDGKEGAIDTTNYRFALQLDQAGETRETARDLGMLIDRKQSGDYQFKDYVGAAGSDQADFYKFETDRSGLVRFALKKPVGDADANMTLAHMELTDENGNFVAFLDPQKDSTWNYAGANLAPDTTYYLKVTPEPGQGTNYNLVINPDQYFEDPVSSSEWRSSFFRWNPSDGKPPLNFYENRDNALGVASLGSGSDRDISFNWSGRPETAKYPNGDSRLLADNYAIRSYTTASFSGRPYRFTVNADDGYQLLAKNRNTGEWFYITPKDKWVSDYKQRTIEYTLPEGEYDLHFHYYEELGDAKFNLSWEEVPLPSGLSGTPLLQVVDASYFLARPQFYTTGNIYWQSYAGSSLVNKGGDTEGNCTWYAYGRVKELGGNPKALDSMWGNANEWHNQLSNGARVLGDNESPQFGDIAQWTRSYKDKDGNEKQMNHVAVVEKVYTDQNGKQRVILSESNYTSNFDGGGEGTLHRIVDYPASEPDRYIRVPGINIDSSGNGSVGDIDSIFDENFNDNDESYKSLLKAPDSKYDIGKTIDFGAEETLSENYAFILDYPGYVDLSDGSRILSFRVYNKSFAEGVIEVRDKQGKLLKIKGIAGMRTPTSLGDLVVDSFTKLGETFLFMIDGKNPFTDPRSPLSGFEKTEVQNIQIPPGGTLKFTKTGSVSLAYNLAKFGLDLLFQWGLPPIFKNEAWYLELLSSLMQKVTEIGIGKLMQEGDISELLSEPKKLIDMDNLTKLVKASFGVILDLLNNGLLDNLDKTDWAKLEELLNNKDLKDIWYQTTSVSIYAKLAEYFAKIVNSFLQWYDFARAQKIEQIMEDDPQNPKNPIIQVTSLGLTKI